MRLRIAFATLTATALALAMSVATAQGGVLERATGQLGGIAAAGGEGTLGGEPCELIPFAPAQAPPVGVGPCQGARPGAPVLTDLWQCTFNFVFTGGGQRYIGTAGHCILEDGGEQSWGPGTGPVARDGSGERIGEFAYAIFDSVKDFALIRLDPGVEADPAMCHFGGPTGINDGNPGPLPPTVLHHFGAGRLVGDVLPGRSAVAAGMPDPDHVYATGAVIFGDSGSGVISADGGAVGVAVTVGVHAGSIGTSGVHAGAIGITRIAPQLERAEQVLGAGLELQTAPLQ